MAFISSSNTLVSSPASIIKVETIANGFAPPIAMSLIVPFIANSPMDPLEI